MEHQGIAGEALVTAALLKELRGLLGRLRPVDLPAHELAAEGVQHEVGVEEPPSKGRGEDPLAFDLGESIRGPAALGLGIRPEGTDFLLEHQQGCGFRQGPLLASRIRFDSSSSLACSRSWVRSARETRARWACAPVSLQVRTRSGRRPSCLAIALAEPDLIQVRRLQDGLDLFLAAAHLGGDALDHGARPLGPEAPGAQSLLTGSRPRGGRPRFGPMGHNGDPAGATVSGP